ncbi:unnamed protein product [Cylicostephanus goldi]|uniref:Uncharacterized protein n=1 Tax=Cylicostephanus goldi TaxID=71465 RepID=A0A3P7M9Q3_CYLGO|nr:unnamed protein product [Cylicostephanus goldi]
MEIVDTIQNLNEYWGPPAQNWFDYFVDASKLADLLAKPGNQETVGRLAIQFAEQAASTQKEGEMMMAKGFSNEDIQFAERKAACLILCAMACFAYIEWDIEYLIDKYNEILSVRILIENLLGLCRSSETPSDAQFAEYLFAKWAMAVDRRYRLPPPPAKQTVNNPLLVPDLQLTKHENIRKMVVDTRTWFPQVISSLEKFIAEAKDLSVPGVNCFLTPFLEKGGMSLGVGIAGMNVLCMWAPRPVFSLSTVTLTGAEIVSACRFELLRFHFANGAMDTALELLKQITLPTSTSPLVMIDRKELNGYYLALNVPSPMPPVPIGAKDFIPDQKLLTDDTSTFRRLRVWRQRAVTRTSGQLQVAFRSENVAKDVLEGRATSVRQRLLEKIIQQRFIKSLQRQISNVRDVVVRRRIDALLIFLCATVAGMREELLRCGWDTPSRLRSLASQAPKTVTPPVSAQIVKS